MKPALLPVLPVLLVLVSVQPAVAQSTNVVTNGMLRVDVVGMMGDPKGSFARGADEVLLFASGSVTLRKGTVISCDLLTPRQYEEKQRLQEEQRRKEEKAARLAPQPPPPSQNVQAGLLTTNSAKLLIIAPESFFAALQPLIDHKNATAMPTILTGIKDVVNSFKGVDDPERIKKGIIYFHERAGIRYVLLAGDASLIPVRHRFVRQVVSGNTNRWLDGTYNPSELYYSNLYLDHHRDDSGSIGHTNQMATWDWNEDGKFDDQLWEAGVASSNNPDHVDGCPDIALGRVPAILLQK